MESLFNEVAGLKAIFLRTPFFEKHLGMTASVISKVTVNPKDNRLTITMELYYSFML